MPKTFPIPRERGNSADREAARTLAVRARPRSTAARTTSNGNTTVGGRSVSGGANVRGGNV